MPSLKVWYDGACPLCRREIAALRKLDRRGAIQFVDVSEGKPESCPISRADLLARFHAEENGRIHSGAAAFAAMWRAFPWLRPLGELARIAPVLWLLERLYRAFLRIRPRLQQFIARKETA